MTDKNHEQYLEQIEVAVAETTMELMSKHNGDLRAMAKVCAEKQVEINRLREYQNNDRKTIRNLRAQLAEAVEESNCFQRDIGRLVEDKNELEEKLVLQRPLGLHIANVSMNTEIEKLKDEIECRNSTWETKEGEYETEIEELNEQYTKAVQDINQRDLERTSLLKEIEKWKYWASEVIHWSHSASKDNLQEKNLITSTDQPTIGDVRDFGKELSELKEEIKGLKEEIEFLKHQLDVGGMMNFSKYNDNDPN